jgi:hypothetical protein
MGCKGQFAVWTIPAGHPKRRGHLEVDISHIRQTPATAAAKRYYWHIYYRIAAGLRSVSSCFLDTGNLGHSMLTLEGIVVPHLGRRHYCLVT